MTQSITSPLFSSLGWQQIQQSQVPINQQLPPPNLDPKLPIKDLLSQMFQPNYFKEQDLFYKIVASHLQLKREELHELKERVNHELYIRQAKNEGICPIRLKVHEELLDQIIRQCTINCPERGLLLMRVRDDLKMTFSAYETLYEGSLVFGNRKTHASEQGIPELQERIRELKKKRVEMMNRKSQLEGELDSTERSFREAKALEEKKRGDEVSFLRRQSQYLEQFLHGI